MNFVEAIKKENNMTRTDNGAKALKSTESSLVDLFGTIGAFRTRSESDILNEFYKGFSEDNLLATRMLFYARDIREGLGERRTFRVILKDMAMNYPDIVRKNLYLISEYGRWDDLFELFDTPIEEDMIELIKKQLINDAKSKTPSLLAKWMKSENASSKQSVRMAKRLRKSLEMTSKEYRQMLSFFRKEIGDGVVEVKMSKEQFDKIDYSKVCSKAMANYRTAFYTRDLDRFEDYIESLKKGETKINAGAIFPYEIFEKIGIAGYGTRLERYDPILEAQWKALPNYVEGKNNILIMADTSGSMTGRPMATALSLAVYFAERNHGMFKDKFITFSQTPSFVELKGDTLFGKTQHIPAIVANTNLYSAFKLILDTAVNNDLPQEDIPKALVVISDMEFDHQVMNTTQYNTLFDSIRQEFNDNGYEIPNVVFWNVDARSSHYQVNSKYKGVQLASGASPSVFKTLVQNIGKNPYEAMTQVLNQERYQNVTI